MRSLYLLTFAGGLTAALVGGCGGKVIVDGVGNEGGQGGQESSNSSVSNVISVGGASTCGFPAPIGALYECGPTSNSSGGGPDVCSPFFCDEEKNLYEVNCTGTSCLCSFLSADGSKKSSCSCTLPSACSSAIPCCPFTQ